MDPCDGSPMPTNQASLEALHQELTQLWSQLQGPLYHGLTQRLADADWYLTGVAVGLESLYAFYEISELVYREHDKTSDGAKRVARIRGVYEKLREFSQSDQTPQSRAKILVQIRMPLQLLLAELEGGRPKAGRARKPVVNQLAADINLNLMRLRSYEKMRGGLAKLDTFSHTLIPALRRRDAQVFAKEWAAYASDLGFEEPEALYTKDGVRDVLRKLDRETRQAEARVKSMHAKIFTGRFRDLAGEDPKEDLAEAKLAPVFTRIFQAGFEYLTRAHNAYEHALQLVGGDVGAYRRLAELSLELDGAAAARA